MLGPQRSVQFSHRVTNHPSLPGTGGFLGCMVFVLKQRKPQANQVEVVTLVAGTSRDSSWRGRHTPAQSVTVQGEMCFSGDRTATARGKAGSFQQSPLLPGNWPRGRIRE